MRNQASCELARQVGQKMTYSEDETLPRVQRKIGVERREEGVGKNDDLKHKYKSALR